MTISLLALVDTLDFRGLFVEALGWGNPDQQPQHVTVDDQNYTLTQIAGYKGLRIWHCPTLPPRPIQRRIDQIVGATSTERLLIFTGHDRQDWRWPRRRQLGAANAKLLVHEHLIGQPNQGLLRRLQAIELDLDTNLSLVALLERMREAFDAESETASVQAARLMRTLYGDLEAAHVREHDATLLLARLLFLFFGDDTDMWSPQPSNQFHHYIRDHTTSGNLHTNLTDLFAVLNTPERQRQLPAGSPLKQFRYINGGLFDGQVPIPPLTETFRDNVLEACEFDWSIISPAVFGSMFQTVKSKTARRGGGEHYTTEENIRKTIDPLFLDELRERLEAAWDDKAQLTRLHNDLGRLRFLDPACGCGNFLIVTYRELRALELELLKRRRDLDIVDGNHTGRDRSQLTLDVTADLKVKLDQFYGIEIDEWPARIAETAMLLVDHLANQRTAQEFGEAPDRLPIVIAPTIKHANALRIDWSNVVSHDPEKTTYIFGNPPFVGISLRDAAQTADLTTVWGGGYHGSLDYVTGWHRKALDYYLPGIGGDWAFVTTNSITQGEVVAPLFTPILAGKWRILFAHRTFGWTSEAAEAAAVHCVIIGFTRTTGRKPRLFDYKTVKGKPEERAGVGNITPYLTDGPSVLVHPATKPLNAQLGQVAYGNKPTDDGNLIVEPEDYGEFAADPVAAKYLRPFIGARELLHGGNRSCLWLTQLIPDDLRRSALLRERVDAVRDFRLDSRAASTRDAARTAQLFRQISQPKVPYLAIPRHVSEARQYFLAQRYSPEVICSDANFLAPDPDGLIFAVLSSSMFMTWQRTVGGRIKSDLRFNKLLTYNTFPLPRLTAEKREEIVSAAAQVIAARVASQQSSLATIYNEIASDLALAHVRLDEVVNELFDVPPGASEADRQRALFDRYARLQRGGR